jgi:hypothetical protein
MIHARMAFRRVQEGRWCGFGLGAVVLMAMGTSVFRIRTAVDFPPVLKSDHTMRSCSAASLRARRRMEVGQYPKSRSAPEIWEFCLLNLGGFGPAFSQRMSAARRTTGRETFIYSAA